MASCKFIISSDSEGSDSDRSGNTPTYTPETPPTSPTYTPETPPASPTYTPATPPHSPKTDGYEGDTDNPEWEVEEEIEEEPIEEPIEDLSLKRKQPETPVADEAGPSKRASSPSREDFAQIEARLNRLEKENEFLKEVIIETVGSQSDRFENLLRKNTALVMEEVMKVKADEERSTRWGKQSLAYVDNNMRNLMENEKGRVTSRFARTDYHHNVLSGRVDNFYDNLEYIYNKQKAKNDQFEKLMEEVKKLISEMKKDSDPK